MTRRRYRTPVVLDTNVFVRSFKSRNKQSANRRVIRLWLLEKRLQLIVSEEIIEEYLEIFAEILVLAECSPEETRSMTITLQLPADSLERLRAVAAKNGQSIEAYLQELAEREAATANGTVLASPPTDPTAAQWSNQWQTWAASHRARPELADDSRESIYMGRGE